MHKIVDLGFVRDVDTTTSLTQNSELKLELFIKNVTVVHEVTNLTN